MKSVPSASSSDLDAARSLSRRLGQGAAPPAPAAEAAFSRFRLAPARRGSDAAPPEPAPEPVPPAPPPEAISGFGARRWERLLDWLLSRAGADAVFLVDERGLLVASGGDAAHDELERVGAHLAVVVEQARRLPEPGAAPPAVSIDMGGRVLSGFTLDTESGPLVVGVLGRRPLDPSLRAALQASRPPG